MPDNETLIRNVIERGGELFGIDLDDNGKSELKITLPLSYDFDFLPVDDSIKELPVSSVKIEDTQTIINVSENSPQWKLKVIKPEDRYRKFSNHDGEGTSSTVSTNEPGDRLIDWLKVKLSRFDEEAQQKIKGAKREIIIRKHKN